MNQFENAIKSSYIFSIMGGYRLAYLRGLFHRGYTFVTGLFAYIVRRVIERDRERASERD